MAKRTLDLGRQFRAATVVREAVDKDARTVELAFSSEEPYERWWGVEVLGHATGEADMSWLSSGRAPFLMDHDTHDQIGVVVKAWIDNGGVGRALVRFGKSQRAEEMFQDVLDGVRGNISVGYEITEMLLVEEKDGLATYRCTWKGWEISLVSVPADTTVGVGRGESQDGKKPVSIKRRGKTMAKKPTKRREGEVLEEEKEGEDIEEGKEGEDIEEAKEGEDLDEAKEGEDLEEAKSRRRPARRSAAPAADVRGVTIQVMREERRRTSEIMTLGERYGLAKEAREAVEKGSSTASFRKLVLDKQAAGALPIQTPRTQLGMSGREVEGYSLLRAINACAKRDWRKAGLELEASEQIAQKLGREANGFFVPYDIMTQKRELATTGTSSNLVATQHLAGSFIDLLRNRMMVTRMGAQLMSGLVGNVDIPKLNGGASAYWLGEGESVTGSEQTFGHVTLSPKTVAAKTQFTRRLLLQSTPDVEGVVRNDLINVIGLAIDLAAISGTGGATRPTGILNTTGIGLVALGANGDAPTFGHLVDLESEISADNADEGNLAYLTNTAMRGRLKQTKKDAGSGEFVWTSGSSTEAGFGELNGYKAGVTNQVPNNLAKGTGTGLSAILFGNWADLMIGEWGILDLQADPFSAGDSGGTIVRAFQDVDIAVRHAESFAAIKDAA